MKKYFLLATIVVIIGLMACSKDNKSEKVTDVVETVESEYSIVEKNYGRKNAEIPKIYIDTNLTPNRENYTNASVKVIDSSGQYSNIEALDASIKVRGHTTAHGEKVPYNIKFTETKNVLGMGNSKKWCLVANLFDPTQMRNMLALDFARNMGLNYTPKCEFVELYYNGADQGVYLLCSPVSEGKDKVDLDLSQNDYLLQLQPNYEYSDKVKVTTNAGLIFSIEDGNDKDLTYLNQFLADFEYSIAYGMETFEQYADVDSFVDYYVFNELIKDVDFATSSAYFYIKEGKIYAGPAWDYDLSMGNADFEYYSEYNNVTTGEENYKGFYCQKLWYMYLIQIPEFKEKVIERFYEIQPLIENLTTDNELGTNRIDNIVNIYGADFKNNFTIWNVGEKYGANAANPLPTYEENVESLRNWIICRNNWLKSEWTLSEDGGQVE